MTSTESHRPVILIAIDWYLPAYRAGGPIRSIANLVAALGKEMDFRIVCGNRDLGDTEELPVKTRTWTPCDHATVQYLPQRDWTASNWRAILEEVKPDRLYLNSLYSGPFSRLPWKIARSMDIPTTLAPRGMLGTGALSIKPWRKWAWLHVQRLTGNYDGITWHASTQQESEEIKRWFPRANISIALNLPVPYDPMPLADKKGTVQLLSVGRIHPIKNYALGVSLANALAREGCQVRYSIVGPIENSDEAEQLRALADGVNLELVGPCPPTAIRHHMGEAHLILVPSLNENYGHAVAEAIACGRPVIVSNQTVWSTLSTGSSVSCQPLDLSAWVHTANNLLAMSTEDVMLQSKATYDNCLLDPAHLQAQRHLFAP